jgi:hypothetical protein
MNERPTYEALIAERLEALSPLTGMADAIWARISEELDNEMPQSDDTNGPTNGTGGQSGPALGPVIGLIILAVAGLVFWWNQSGNNLIKRQPNVPAVQIPAPAAKGTKTVEPSPDVGQKNNTTISNLQADSTSIAAPDQQQDAVAPFITPSLQAERTMRPVEDSGSKAFTAPRNPTITGVKAPVFPPRQTDTPVIKKPRGVTGINSSDYRIVPAKKDSMPE